MSGLHAFFSDHVTDRRCAEEIAMRNFEPDMIFFVKYTNY